MNPTEQGLLHAIVHEPDDDTHRLVYADWLDDHGDPERAEFIRAQVQLALDPNDSPQRRELAFRAWQLQGRQEATTRDHWLSLGLHPRFRRGFIEGLRLDRDSLNEGCPGFEGYPLRSLEIVDLYDGIEMLGKIPADNQVTSLDLTGTQLEQDDLWCLDELTNLPRLQRLSLQFCGLDDDAITRLCEMSIFQRLSLLRLGANPFTEAGYDRLLDHFGDRVRFVAEREDDTLYAFASGYSFVAGFFPDHWQVLLIAFADGVREVLFDFEGRLLEKIEHPLPAGLNNLRWWGKEWEQFAAGWKEEIGLTEAVIRVRRFHLDLTCGIRDFAYDWETAAGDSDSSEEERESIRDWINGWQNDNKFAWDWSLEPGGDWWFDHATGEVTDT